MPEPLAFPVHPQVATAAVSQPGLASQPTQQNMDHMTPEAAEDLTDDEPIVVLDDESIVLDDDAPALSAQASAYLTAQGITARTAAAFRIDAVGEAVERLLTTTQRRQLRPGGLWLPTCDPRKPDQILGLIRLNPVQHQHRHLGPVAGVAAPVDLDVQPRVVLVDNPLLGLRLHELGVSGIAIVEDPAALVPLAGWLTTKTLVTLTTAKRGNLPLPEGITPAGTGRIVGALEHAPAAVLDLVGLDRADLCPAQERLPLDLRAVRDLHAYAERQVQTEAGLATLAASGLDHPETMRAYRLGYLPATVRQAFSPEQRRMFQGYDLGNSVVMPAFDAQGAVVDLVLLRAAYGQVWLSLWDQPRGLCAPTVATAFERICVTSVAGWVGRLMREVGPTLLLRGGAHAQTQVQAEAARIAAAGVRHAEIRCRMQADSVAIAAALEAVGITAQIVTDEALKRPGMRLPGLPTALVDPKPVPVPVPSPVLEPTVAPEPASASPVVSDPPPAAMALVLVSHDAQAETAIFRYGPATYTVQVPWGTTTTAAVTLAVGPASYRDRFDLAVAPQRLRYAATAGLRIKLPPADIATAVALILPAVQALAAPAPVPVAPVDRVPGLSATDHEAALALLRSPDLLPQWLADLASVGWADDPALVTTVLLAALSRLGEEPVWAALTATVPGERFPALGILAAITPPEQVLHISRLTDNALFHGGPEALRHKLLILDDLAGVSAPAATALRVLHARGALSGTTVERDPLRGGMRTRIVQVQGPVAVITATTGTIPATLRQQVIEVVMDDSPAQAERLLAARSRPVVNQPALQNRWRNAQRLLRPLPVTLPTAGIPAVISRQRALHATFIGFVAASALLHQYQRPVLEGRLCATAADLDLAHRAILPLVGQFVEGYGARAQTALTALHSLGSASFSMADAARLLPDWSLGTVRRAMDDLLSAECVVALRRRNGVRAEYRVLDTTVPAAPPADLVSVSGPFQAGWHAPTREVAHG